MLRTRTISMLTSFAVLTAIFCFYGNSSNLESSSRSIFTWTYNSWFLDIPEADTSHGPIVVLFSAFLVWRRRHALSTTQHHFHHPSLLILLMGMSIHLIGFRAQYTFLSLIGLLACMFAIPAFLYGRSIGKILLFPCLFLLFAIPWGFVRHFSFPLRLFSTHIAGFLLNGLGLPVEISGTAITPLFRTGMVLAVEDPCSGLRSITALCATTAAWAYLSSMRLPLKWALFAMAIPIAVIANILRIVSVGVAARFFTRETVLTFYHDFSGGLAFILALLLIIKTSTLIQNWARQSDPAKRNEKSDQNMS